MKVCFHFENFDADVSSGTIHSMYQWYELLLAFNTTEVAIVNLTDFNIPHISSEVTTTVYKSLSEFVEAHSTENLCYVNLGGEDYKTYDFSNTDWLVFGSSSGSEMVRADVGINTGIHALYPREAAAIILAKATWQ